MDAMSARGARATFYYGTDDARDSRNGAKCASSKGDDIHNVIAAMEKIGALSIETHNLWERYLQAGEDLKARLVKDLQANRERQNAIKFCSTPTITSFVPGMPPICRHTRKP